MAGCTVQTDPPLCRDWATATHFKLAALTVVFLTSIIGISTPIAFAQFFRAKSADSNIILVVKCFAAGVILSTSLVHVLPDAFEALADCKVRAHHPWRDFPFTGFVSLIGALLALLIDIIATSHAENYHYIPGGSNDYSTASKKSRISPYCNINLDEDASVVKIEETEVVPSHDRNIEELSKPKKMLVSQVLEIGIVFHSVIIGGALGMSQNWCTIRPLIAALSFHQIFEGMGLGGCIAQAGFNFRATASMCMVFALTTPMGIVFGMLVFQVTGYSDNIPSALILEGLLGSLSSGILLYMGLVDLIAADFFHSKSMGSRQWLKKASYIALLLGSASMSVLAIWA